MAVGASRTHRTPSLNHCGVVSEQLLTSAAVLILCVLP